MLKKRGALHLARGARWTTKHKHPQPATLELLAFSCALPLSCGFSQKKKEKNVITPTIVYKINVTRSWDLQNEGRVYNRGGKCSGSGPPSGELAEKGIFSFQKGELHSGYRS